MAQAMFQPWVEVWLNKEISEALAATSRAAAHVPAAKKVALKPEVVEWLKSALCSYDILATKV